MQGSSVHHDLSQITDREKLAVGDGQGHLTVS